MVRFFVCLMHDFWEEVRNEIINNDIRNVREEHELTFLDKQDIEYIMNSIAKILFNNGIGEILESNGVDKEVIMGSLHGNKWANKTVNCEFGVRNDIASISDLGVHLLFSGLPLLNSGNQNIRLKG